jgi:hypothetical protein
VWETADSFHLGCEGRDSRHSKLYTSARFGTRTPFGGEAAIAHLARAAVWRNHVSQSGMFARFSPPGFFSHVLPGPPNSANLLTILGPISSYSAFV